MIANRDSVPGPTVRRLSLYLRQLEQFAAEGIDKASSSELAKMLDITGALVRKDLSYFGQFGQPGVGYAVKPLIKHLRHILGTDKTRKVIVVGAGDLGQALLRYNEFLKRGFELVAAFDISPAKVGEHVDSMLVHHIDKLPEIVREHNVKLAVMAVPGEAAQSVVDMLCQAGITGILNFTSATLHTPPNVTVNMVCPAASLEQLSFQVGSLGK